MYGVIFYDHNNTLQLATVFNNRHYIKLQVYGICHLHLVHTVLYKPGKLPIAIVEGKATKTINRNSVPLLKYGGFCFL